MFYYPSYLVLEFGSGGLLLSVYSFFPVSHTISLLWFITLVVNGMTEVTVLSRLLKDYKIDQGLHELLLLSIECIAMSWRDWAELEHLMKFLVWVQLLVIKMLWFSGGL